MKPSRNPYYAPQPTSLPVNSTTQFGGVVKGFKDSRISFQFASFLSLSAIVLIGSQSAQAVTKTWDAGGTTSDWNSANNWDVNGVPGSGDDVLFDNSGQPTLENVYLNAAQSINSLTLDLSSNQAWSLGADNNNNAFTLTLATGNVTVNSTSNTGTYVIGAVTGTGIGSGVMTLATSGSGFTFDNERTNGGLLQINAIVSGTKTVAKTGAGSVILSGANTYTGATSISDGVLNIQNASALGTIAGATTVSSGAALEIQGGITTLAEALTLNGTGILGGGALRNISGTNTYAGAITLNSATRINSDAGTLTLNVASGNAITGTNQDVTFGGAGNVTVSDTIATGSGTLTKDGNGILTLSATNTYTGLTDVQAGTLTLGANNIFADTSTIKVSGGILSQNTRTDTVAGVQLTAGSITGTTGVLTSTTAFDLQAGSASAILGGSVGVNKTTAGTVMLTGANTYTGATAVSDGILNIQNANALGTIAGATTVSNGAALQIQGGITTLAEALTLNGTGISNDGALRNVSGNNIYAGAITLGSATRINSDSGTLTLNVASGNAIAGTNQNITFGGAGNVTVSDAISIGSGTLTKDGAGTVTLSVANTYTGGTTINEGVLNFGVAGAIGGTGANLTVNAGGTASAGYAVNQAFLDRIAGSSTGVVALGVNSANALNFNTAGLTAARLGASGTFTYSGTLTPNGTTYRVGGGGGALTISAALTGAGNTLNMGLGGNSGGTVALTAANTYGGATVIDEGTLTLSGANGAIASSSGVTIHSGGTLILDNTTANTNRIGAVTLTLKGGTFDFAHPTTGGGTYSETLGQLLVDSGASSVNSDVVTGGGSSSLLTFASVARTTGATLDFTGAPSSASNDNNVRFTTTPTLVNSIIGGYATAGGTGWATYTGGGTASVEALGTYVTTTTNGNTATSYTNDNLDVTSSQAPNGVITPNSIRFNNGTARTLTLQGTTNTITSGGILVTAAATNGGTITGGTLRGASGTDLVVHQYSAGTFLIDSIIGDNTSATGLTKSGTGILTLGGTNSYTGTTTVNAGTLILSGGAAIANIGAVSMANAAGATLQLNASETIGSLTGGGSKGGDVTLGANTLTVGDAGNTTFAGVISGSGGALTKQGSGILTLNGLNTYTGDTTIKAGTLKLGGSGSIASTKIIVGDAGSSGAVLDATATGLIIASGKTLGGVGTIQGSTTIQGILAPGNSAGVLNNLGDIELEITSTYQMEIGGTVAGTGYDQLNVTGSVTLAGLLAVNTGLYVPSNGDLFFLIANDGADAIAGRFSNANVDDSTVITLNDRQWLISYSANFENAIPTFTGGNDVALMAVPEPHAALIGGIGVLFLLRRRRA